jgi:hypothetical protein
VDQRDTNEQNAAECRKGAAIHAARLERKKLMSEIPTYPDEPEPRYTDPTVAYNTRGARCVAEGACGIGGHVAP